MYKIFLLTAFAGFGFSIYFFANFKKGRIFSCLSLLTFFYSLSSLISYGLLTDFFTESPEFIGTPGAVAFLFTPTLYFFFVLQSGYAKKLKWTAALHFIPFAQDLIFFMPFYLMPGEQKLMMLDKPISGFSMMIISFGIIYRWAYIAFIWRTLKRTESVDSPNRKFLLWIFFSHVLFVSFGTISKIVHFITAGESYISYIGSFSGVTGLAIIAYFFIKHRTVFTTDFYELAKNVKKYSTSSLKPNEIEQINKSLIHSMETEKPYLDSDITLRILAETIEVLPNNLSQVINHIYGENFNKFVNRHRVNEVKKMLMDPQKNILEAAYACGFNSKSSFNQAFKEVCNQTPSEFRKTQEKL